MTTHSPTPVRRSRAVNSRPVTVAGWVLAVGLALAMVGAGITKLTGDPTMVTLFTDIGAGQGLRYVVGALEVAGAIGLLVPRLRALAALGLLLLLLGATITNLAVLQVNTIGSAGLAVLAAVVLILRRRELPRGPVSRA